MQMKIKTKSEYSRKVYIRFICIMIVMMSGLFGCSKSNEYVMSIEEISECEEKVLSEQKNETKQTVEELTYIYVDICGAVKYPGVYRLDTEARVFEVIELAGGMTEEAAQVAINQAQILCDGQKIYIPTQDEWDNGLNNQADANQISDIIQDDGRININTADLSMLCNLPGIGETRAAAIIRYREEQGEFVTVEDIQKVSGIKSGTYEKIKDYIKIK